MTTVTRQAPETFEDAAAALASATAEGQARAHRRRGLPSSAGATRSRSARPRVELHTTGLDEIVEHNAGDLTAILQAGVPLARAQRTFAAAGQMLALDPPLDPGARPRSAARSPLATAVRCATATVRRVTSSSGATVALSDGTIARSGGKVIKNVAGYDLAKLFSGLVRNARA